MTSRFSLFLLIAILGATASPTDAQAQARSSTDGLFLHARAGGHGVAFEDAGDDTGGSIGLRLGYGLSDHLTLFVGAEGGSLDGGSRLQGLDGQDDSGVVYLEAGGRLHILPRQRLVPYVDAAFAVVGAGADRDGGDVAYAGLGGSLGLGALYFVSPTIALEGGATFTPGVYRDREIGDVETDVDIGVAGVRMHVGFSVYPFR
ncbi:MAG: hypothetical protein Rubg2KO_21790 [Rubricoccaceae bacterium]